MASRTCYNPSREAVAHDSPCIPDADVSFCCGPGFVCGTNSLCYKNSDANFTDGTPFIFRGSCTDPTWNSPDCPQQCRGGWENEYEKDDTVGIYECHPTVFECSVDEQGIQACLYNATVFPLPTFENITTIGGNVGPAYSTAFSSSTTASSATLTSSGASSATTSSSSTSSSSTSSTSSPTAAPASGGLSTGAKAGIGAGVVVAVLVVLAIIALLYYCMRQRKETAELRQHIAGIYERQNSQKGNRPWPQPDQEQGPPVPLQVYHKMAEPVEMDSSRQLQELPATFHGGP